MAELNPDIKQAYEQLAWNALLREDLGNHNLKGAKKDFEQIKKLFDDILFHPNFAELPYNLVQKVQNQLDNFLSFAQEVRDFKNLEERNNFIERAGKWKDGIIRETFDARDHMRTVGSHEDEDFEKKKEELLDARKVALDNAKKAEDNAKKAEENAKKAEAILQSAQTEKQKEEGEKFGTFFGDEAKENKRRAHKNFRTMIGCIVVTAILAVAFYFDGTSFSKDGQVDYGMLASNALLKFFVLSLGVFLIAHFSKGHAAERHLYNLNRQRQNALNSHRAILDSVMATDSDNEKEVKNLILLELTKAIFDSKDTGYIKGNEKGSLNISLPQIKT